MGCPTSVYSLVNAYVCCVVILVFEKDSVGSERQAIHYLFASLVNGGTSICNILGKADNV